MSECISCNGERVAGMDFGLQPVTNHYHTANVRPPAFPLTLSQCTRCSLVQLSPPFPYQSLSPPHAWITYKEPEGHLDHLCDQLALQMKGQEDKLVLGASYKDGSTVERMAARGFKNTRILDVRTDLGAAQAHPNIESVPGLLTPAKALELSERYGKAGVIIARHVLEHAENIAAFMEALGILLAKDGLLVFEVPDCEANMERSDISMIWEEHASYFTEYTFNDVFPRFGYDVSFYKSYPLRFENCLVAFVRANKATRNAENPQKQKDEKALFVRYCREIEKNRQAVRNFLKEEIARGQKFAIYGAGHLACAFITLYELQDFITCIVDDTPEKQGLYLPGTDLPIEGKSALTEHGITRCLLALSVEIEDKVIARNDAFTQNGGAFFSIFAASPRSFSALFQ